VESRAKLTNGDIQKYREVLEAKLRKTDSLFNKRESRNSRLGRGNLSENVIHNKRNH